MDLKVKYLGLDLKNPVIAGSSGLCANLPSLKRLEDNGAAAVVLKSLFEEQLHKHAAYNYSSSNFEHTEAYDYINRHSKESDMENYLELIEQAKSSLDIPVIASINAHSKDSWTDYTKRVEEAGADAIEINVSLLPSDCGVSSKENEQIYFDILKAVRKQTNLPLALKMSYFSAGLAQLIQKLSWTKDVDAFVLFNRYFSPDIDIDDMSMTSSNIYSSPDDITTSLRWIAIMSDQIKQDLAASTGVHNGAGIAKQILAGATVVQMVSAIYKHGEPVINKALEELKTWMQKKEFNSLDDFRAKLNYKNSDKSKAYERIQFMKYYSGIE